MFRHYRLLALAALIGLGVWLSRPSQGEPTAKSANPATPVRPAATRPAQDFEADLAKSKFAMAPLHLYQPLEGDPIIALQVQPKLPAAPERKRDYVILISTSASQAGAGWIGSNQIADAFVETAQEGDRIALWTVSTHDKTKAITEHLLDAKADAFKLKQALKSLKKSFPIGITDLKDALTRAIETFDGGEGRQRVILFLGDGQSTGNPLTHEDRAQLCKEMVARRIAFFAVPLGTQLDPANLHGFATGTGGAVLRTRVTEEKLVDALKRYQDALATPIMYDAKITLPAAVTEAYPLELPPLRSETPTLIVGRMKNIPKLAYTITGTVAGQAAPLTIQAELPTPASEADNFFLLSMIEQWKRAATQPALLRADRALISAYQQAMVMLVDLKTGAELAMRRNELDGAAKLFAEAKRMSPRDGEAEAGLKIVARLKDGTLTRDAILKQLDQARAVDQVKKVNGQIQVARKDLEAIAALQQEEPEKVAPPAPAGNAPNILQANRDRVIIEEQKMTQMVEDALRAARRELNSDPDGTVEMLKNTLRRVEDHPEIGQRVRDTLAARLQTSLREASTLGRQIKLKIEEQNRILTTLRENAEKADQKVTFEERQAAQFKRFKEEMTRARFEERAKSDLLAQMTAMAQESRMRGEKPPVSLQAVYDRTLALYHLQKQADLRRVREERFLATLLEVDKSQIPFPDEPGIFFPPLATWKAITKLRKEKYEVSSLPDDDAARFEANALSRLLEDVIDMSKDFQNQMTLKEVLGLFYEKYQAKGKELPILVDQQAFKDESPDAPEIYEATIKFPPYPKMMSMATALKLALSQASPSATYLIRRSFIEITTNDKALKDQVLRVYPVGELVIPVNALGGQQQFQTASASFGGGFGGVGGGLGGLGGGLGGLGGLGGGLGGLGGGLGGFGGGFQGFAGGQVSGAFQGGGFQGGFNGSLGIMGASNAPGLIELVTRVVDPGKWFFVTQAQPFNPSSIASPFANPFGGAGGGLPGQQFGANPGAAPPTPPSQGGAADPTDPFTHTIDFFPPALALIVRAPSRVHTSISGGVIGGKYTKTNAAAAEAEKRNLAMVGPKGQLIQPGANAPQAAANNTNKNKDNKNQNLLAQAKELPKLDPEILKQYDPHVIWEEAFAKGGIDPGLVIATADFLFEAGQPYHVAELLKANLRHGVVVRPWVYEALAIALEMTKGDPEEIRQARMSAVALDPNDAQGFLQAARAMADGKQYDRAVAFCRQAALLEPNSPEAYSQALTYAQLSKDSKAMEWAAGKLVSQDWPSDNLILQKSAEGKMIALADTLRQEQRGTDAERLRAALQLLKERDLAINLTWETPGGETTGLEMEIKEPIGSVCSLQQKQTPGGGTLLSPSLTDSNRISYLAAQAFSGDYEITVRRIWGQTVGSRARLEVIHHLGTPRETRELHTVRLDQKATLRISLSGGRRTEMAYVPPTTAPKSQEAKENQTPHVLEKLRGLAFPDFSGATAPRVSSTSNSRPSVAAAARAEAPAQSAVRSGAVQMTTQLRASDQNGLDMVLRPVFQNIPTSRSNLNLPGIPGGGL